MNRHIAKLLKHEMASYNRPALKNLEGKKDLVGVEIGVMLGINARRILMDYDIKTLYLIDPYLPNTVLDANKDFTEEKIELEVENTAKKLLEEYNDKIVWMKDFSWNVVDLIPDNLDFVYIDGDHSYNSALKDLELYYPKIKKGGLFSGHDYVENREPDLMVKAAVATFFKKLFKTTGNPAIIHFKRRDWWHIKE